jgi:hypothetical protein
MWSNRLPRGRSYARQGRVVDLAVGAGVVTAGVVGTRKRPYRVEISLPALDADGWSRGLERLADDTLLVIRLLDRELPDEVGERLRSVGVELFPRRGELSTECSCPDWANPCKHIAAVHYLFAAALDNDPFLLFRLRGLDRDDLVAGLAGDDARPVSEPAVADDSDGDGLESAAEVDVATFLGRDLDPPVLDIDPRAPGVELIGLKRLGPPPRGLERLPALVAPAVKAAGRLALELAWREAGPKTPPVEVSHAETSPPKADVEEPKSRRKAASKKKTAGTVAGADYPSQTVVDVGTRSPRYVVSPAAVERLVQRVEEVLSEAGRALSKRELMAAVEAPHNEVTGALRRLRDGRLVVPRGRGPATRYATAEKLAPIRRARRGQRSLRPVHDTTSLLVEVLGEARSAMSLRTLAERLGATPEELRPVILSLRQNGVVEMVGRRRSARYRLVR